MVEIRARPSSDFETVNPAVNGYLFLTKEGDCCETRGMGFAFRMQCPRYSGPLAPTAQTATRLLYLFDTRSGNILSFLLPLFQEGQLSVTGESMCTKYWLTA